MPTYDGLDAIWARGGEGVMLKSARGLYRPGKRSSDWLKIKTVETADGVILGYNPGEGKYSDTTGSIIIGQYGLPLAPGRLLPVTNISGMTDEMRYSLGPEHIGQVVEFAYQKKTRDSYRHPRFKRFRPDKDSKECTWT
jgi:ATP-dependent DNA ligase